MESATGERIMLGDDGLKNSFQQFLLLPRVPSVKKRTAQFKQHNIPKISINSSGMKGFTRLGS